MAAGGACLFDTNIPLRISKGDDPDHPVIVRALKASVGQGVRLCYTSHTLAGFRNASTRPLDKNGFRLSIAKTDLVAHSVQGVQVPDARLAASMYVHGVGQTVTINVRDFKRFDGLRVVHPADVPATITNP